MSSEPLNNSLARVGKPGRPERQPLFRPEVLAERQTQWLGAVLLDTRISAWALTIAAVLAALAVLAFLALGTFTRKARINGWLLPQQGLARIIAPYPGVVTQLHVREGTTVAKDAPLVTLSAEVSSVALGATKGEVVRRLADRRDSLQASIGNLERHYDQQAEDKRRRLETIHAEHGHLAQEIKLQMARLWVSEEALRRERQMRERELITVTRLLRTEQEHLEQEGKLHALVRSQAALERQRVQLQGALEELPFRHQKEFAEIERNIATLKQEMAEAEARRQIVITAPQDGTVTAIQAELGGSATPNVPLMSILPADSVLHAQLFSPSRAIGFISPGQSVLLRFQAFPYQKFGSYAGVVSSISRSAMSPSELPPQMVGLTALHGGNEPVYRVTVSLARQTVSAYGTAMPLQPGMQLEADVLIETRRLFEWMLDPLYSLTGKLGR